ncbi:MAG: hypothetical protein FJ276_00565 [Planctomycetes bacterium]|nr:hypothetical protein [Planctomycetota bacterium]
MVRAAFRGRAGVCSVDVGGLFGAGQKLSVVSGEVARRGCRAARGVGGWRVGGGRVDGGRVDGGRVGGGRVDGGRVDGGRVDGGRE